jgi:hypothetical protein
MMTTETIDMENAAIGKYRTTSERWLMKTGNSTSVRFFIHPIGLSRHESFSTSKIGNALIVHSFAGFDPAPWGRNPSTSNLRHSKADNRCFQHSSPDNSRVG